MTKKKLPVFKAVDGEIKKITLVSDPPFGVGFVKCKEVKNGIKSIYIMEMPLNLDRIDFMSELTEDEAKERGGIDCAALSPDQYKIVKEMKQMIKDAEHTAEEYFQELNNPEQGEYYLSKVDAWKEVIKSITGNKPILKQE